jgi:hypothetical protein
VRFKYLSRLSSIGCRSSAACTIVDRAVVRHGNGVDALVGKLIVIHDATLPLMLALANLNAALEIARHRLQMLDQLRFLVVDHSDKLLVIGAATAWPARRQWRERSRIAVT